MAIYDVNTKLIPEDNVIWALHAGRGKRQHRLFDEFGVVFLEIPGFSPSNKTFSNMGLLRRHLRMSDEIYRYIVGARSDPPSRSPNLYSDQPDPTNRSFNAAVGNVRSLYHDAKVGDLILVPGFGHYSPVLIGEISSSMDSEMKFPLFRSVMKKCRIVT